MNQIAEHVKLAFDPTVTNEDRVIEIFLNPTARTLWLAWRPTHIVNQHFGDEVLDIAAEIDREKPTTPESLASVMLVGRVMCSFTNFVGDDVRRWAPLALPYFTGEKAITFETVPR